MTIFTVCIIVVIQNSTYYIMTVFTVCIVVIQNSTYYVMTVFTVCIVVIQNRHLMLYSSRVEMGLSRYSPEVSDYNIHCVIHNYYCSNYNN